ncbi:MAG: GDP-fucose synthetase [Candidatus Magasanikbacteria bacterium RIFOXYD2_FULL_39_9]|uniref:GDP-L-fucose synthase n=1 Tax=Candidatus Magasanikbacteria bacterium RIFOXYD1_FULL_40_23 TaxID=1798705 RepID=A0A1F6P9Y3_9BACT|nr:MAG: GDP-fucose synthetase [Candidatus Magasanikbacteria bacterium RIFOXYD2_FULL_39_9]OGH92850.1 MAG: GDP-fucose synthetase [Candidatus Magasanikbacteria bacterium RIFOXYD1_FULL_40_23]
MDKNSKIYVSGHNGLVGTALVNELKRQGYENIVTRSHKDLELLDQVSVNKFFEEERPEYVFHLAAKVGGIIGNKTYPADFTYENTIINFNVIHAAHQVGVKKLLNFGSICIYPLKAEVPVKESSLLTGPLESSNEGYAISKIASLMLCKKYKEQYGSNFISVMPANLYGPHDNFHPQNAHVIPMLMDRFHKAKVNGDQEVVVWGTGKPTRDFLYSEDLAEGLVLLMNKYDELEHINIGPGAETSIRELAETMKEVVGFNGGLVFDISKPDGTPRRYLDIEKMNGLGWNAKTSLKNGLSSMYAWYLDNADHLNSK